MGIAKRQPARKRQIDAEEYRKLMIESCVYCPACGYGFAALVDYVPHQKTFVNECHCGHTFEFPTDSAVYIDMTNPWFYRPVREMRLRLVK